MKRIVFAIFLLFISFYAGAQQPVQSQPAADKDTLVPLHILHADRVREETKDSVKYQSLIGNVQLLKGTTYFYCDSVVMNNKDKVIEAFGKVHMNDSDTTHIYSDYMKYFEDKKFVIFQKNVKMTDGKATLYTEELNYDLSQKIGTYNNGGKLINETSVLTSKEGTYYADTKDIYFKKDVYLKDPAYDLRTDSLLYNTQSKLATFITLTHIKDSSGSTIDTKEGNYDLKNRKAEFGKRPTIRQGSQKIIGDVVKLDDSTGKNIATGNAVFTDSVQGLIIISNSFLGDRKTKSFLATQSPLMIIKQEDDSIYVAADTLFSAKLSDLLYADSIKRHEDSIVAAQIRIKDSIRNDSIKIVKARIADSVRKVNALIAKENKRISDSTELAFINISDSTFLRGVIDQQNSLRLKPEKKGRRRPAPKPPSQTDSTKNAIGIKQLNGKDSSNISPHQIDSLNAQKKLVKVDSLKGDIPLNQSPHNDSSLLPNKRNDSALTKNIIHEKDSVKNSVAIGTTAGPNDSADRYLQGYHHVRIFSDSLQAVSDSLFYSAKDSVFQLFSNPVVWANGTQITGDTIYIFTKNKKPSRVYVFENGLVVNKVGNNLYNQLKGTTINIYFKNGAIDYVRAKGNAESIYYSQDEDKSFFGVNQSKADIIDIIFVTRELNKVILRNDAEGTMYPIKKVNFDEMRLRNFKWLEDQRPKTKYELFGK